MDIPVRRGKRRYSKWKFTDSTDEASLKGDNTKHEEESFILSYRTQHLNEAKVPIKVIICNKPPSNLKMMLQYMDSVSSASRSNKYGSDKNSAITESSRHEKVLVNYILERYQNWFWYQKDGVTKDPVDSIRLVAPSSSVFVPLQFLYLLNPYVTFHLVFNILTSPAAIVLFPFAPSTCILQSKLSPCAGSPFDHTKPGPFLTPKLRIVFLF